MPNVLNQPLINYTVEQCESTFQLVRCWYSPANIIYCHLTGPATVPPNGAETGPAPWQSSGGYAPPASHPGQYDQNSHPGGNAAIVRPSTAQKIDHLKKWSISTYKCTRQYLSEKFGKGTKTVDTEIETQIQVLRETQLRYISLLKLARQMMQHFQNMVQTQKNLGDSLADLGMKSPELQDEFTYNADAQKTLVKNGEILLGALQFFTSNLTTLCHKTMDDSIVTVKAYEAARIEYDAYRTDMEAVLSAPRTQATAARAEDTRLEYEQQKQRFDRLRNDLAIKLKFLEENKVSCLVHGCLTLHPLHSQKCQKSSCYSWSFLGLTFRAVHELTPI